MNSISSITRRDFIKAIAFCIISRHTLLALDYAVIQNQITIKYKTKDGSIKQFIHKSYS